MKARGLGSSVGSIYRPWAPCRYSLYGWIPGGSNRTAPDTEPVHKRSPPNAVNSVYGAIPDAFVILGFVWTGDAKRPCRSSLRFRVWGLKFRFKVQG